MNKKYIGYKNIMEYYSAARKYEILNLGGMGEDHAEWSESEVSKHWMILHIGGKQETMYGTG